MFTALLLFTQLVITQFVAQPSNLTTKRGYAGINVRYKQVPAGICEQNPNVRSFSGFADVSENEHIFWWFFEARNVDPTTAPLTIWINGGPGSSSMIGLFQELGPCGVNIEGNVYDNPYSWSNVSNMVFIDQPTTTGFSYSIPIPGFQDSSTNEIVALPNATCPDYADTTTCGTYNVYNTSLTANSTVAAAPNFYLTLQAFTGAFPQYSSHGVFFATESYGGHYAPIFSRYILEQNELNTTGTAFIDLRAVLVGNGWFNPILQYQAYYNFTSNYSTQLHQGGNTYGLHYNASIDAYVFNNMYGAHNCLDQLLDCNTYPYATNASDGTGNQVCSAADSWCYNQVELPYDNVLGRDEYDIRYLTPDPFPYSFYVDYLNRADVQSAIGAFTNFTQGSSITSTAFSGTGDDARETGVTAAVEYILDHNVTFVMYFGDADFNCNWFGGEAFSKTLTNTGTYNNGSAGFANITTTDGITHGQVKTAGKFSFVRIFEAGHEVPFYQPLVSLEMLNRTIQGYDIATGTTPLTSDYFTKGPVDSTYINGNATVTYEVLPMNATYNTTTNQPNPPYDVASERNNDDGTSSFSSGGKLLTRLHHAKLDFMKAKAKEAELGVPWSSSKRVVQKKGRHMLFEESGRRKKQDHGHVWKQEM
ncbi:hypothetical protein LTR64_001103 [Lithohypha guttulata]|uniref:uncharacterized protein n=1 Tax=Lithohypha guttulata TaxID=1690604 RepID=UPI002DDE7D3F|nr:hypothetical protein LTR51_003297 [Lithohypha guttulata]